VLDYNGVFSEKLLKTLPYRKQGLQKEANPNQMKSLVLLLVDKTFLFRGYVFSYESLVALVACKWLFPRMYSFVYIKSSYEGRLQETGDLLTD